MGGSISLESYSISQNSLLTMKYCSLTDCNGTSSCDDVTPAYDKGVLVDFNSYKENKSPFRYFQKSPPL